MKYLPLLLIPLPLSALGHVELKQKLIVMQEPESSVILTNNGERTEFIHLSLARLMNPGVPVEHEKLIPLGEVAEPNVYAFPLKMTLQPGQSKKVFINRLRPVKQEEVYRLIIEPQIRLKHEDGGDTGTGVVLNVGYRALLRLLPEKSQEAFSIRCLPGGGEVLATGNVRYSFDGVTIAAKKVEVFNVYPGTPHRFQGSPLRYKNQDYCL